MRSVIIMLFIVGVAHVFIGRFSITMEKKEDIGSVEDTLPDGNHEGLFLFSTILNLTKFQLLIKC